MTRLIKKFRPLFALLLLLQATTVYALPADIHLNLCFGPDGHLEISTDFCADNQLTEQSPPLIAAFSSEDHHGDCLDIISNCDSEEELFSPSEKALLTKTEIIENNPPLVGAKNIYSSSYQVIQTSILNSCLKSRTSSPAHLGFISTTVLLI